MATAANAAERGKKVIFQRFPYRTDRRSFPFPLLDRDADTEYICFTDHEEVHSSVWKIQLVRDLKEADLEPYLEQYAVRRELQPNQIQMGPLLQEASADVSSGEPADTNIVTVPSLENLPLFRLEPEKIIPTADAEGNYIFRENPVYSGGKYNGRPLLLTIGVPVSNQIATIDRCLSHIKPLLDQLDAELLVIDTGSMDGTAEVCQRYGARVIARPWDGNMSAARNEGIFHAKGEWYLSIDDDEWFEDVSDILCFFREGYYHSYDQASYIQRNYMDSGGKVYEDNHTLRMARITPGLHFEGRIHDALVTEPRSNTVFLLKSYAHHYGFVSDDPEKVRAKVMRNVPILLQDVYEYPENLRYLFQLANEYRNLRYGETAIGLFAQTMAMAKEAGDLYREKNSMVMLCACLMDMDDTRLFQWADRIGKDVPLTVPEQAFLAWGQEMLAFRTQQPPGRILEYYGRYEELLRRHQENPSSGQYQTYYGLSSVEHERYIMDAAAAAFTACSAEREEEKALELLDRFSLDRLSARIHSAVLEEGLAAGNRLYDAVCGKMTAGQWEEWSGDILDAFMKGINRDSTYRRTMERLPKLLEQLSVPAIVHWSDHAGERKEGEAEKRLYEYAMQCTTEGCSVQKLCFCAWTLKEAYVRNREEECSGDVFRRYLLVLAAFAEGYYNQDLLTDVGQCAIPSDIRAAYCMAVVLADGEASHENIQLLKLALGIFPPYHAEIRSILQDLNIN